jgi:superfamily II RNA helicase
MVGLLTGDTSQNRNGRIVVMTTEVFRNMLYGMNEDAALLPDVGYVVLDECHFMNDADRGTVWEESIIYCPPSLQMVALSATVANADELTRWIDHIHPDCDLVSTNFRPVPLHFHYYAKRAVLPLFDVVPADGKPGRMNQRLRDLRASTDKRAPKGGNAIDMIHLLDEMDQRQMLPAIVFVFSRKGCDKALKDCAHLDLTTDLEKANIRDLIADMREQTSLELEPWREEALINGLASHHAGLLPANKVLVETLFQSGWLRAVFATETLAAGINMPARSTVISTISKRTDVGHRLLTSSEFLQMSGRAGRRGMDELGHVVVVHSAFHDAAEVAKLAGSNAEALNSQFTPTYGMVLNLLPKISLEQAGFLVSKSFGAYTVDRRTAPLSTELTERQDLLNEALNFPCPHELTLEDFQTHLKDRERMSAFNREVSHLQRQAKRFGEEPALQAELERVTQDRHALGTMLDGHVCANCELFKKHRRAEERIDRISRQVNRLQSAVDEEKNVYWQQFLNLTNLLKAEGMLDEHNKPTVAGIITSKIRSENEVYVANAIMRGLFDELEAHELAAVVSAMVNDSSRENIFSQLRYSKPVRRTLDKLHRLAHQLQQTQQEHHVTVGINLNPALSSIAEAWARGMEWSTLMSMTTADAGDLVRNFRRTADLLRQLSVIEEVPPAVAHAAHIALLGIYRDPIKEIEYNKNT